tara:strand:+ start:3940 stop:4341 length:402 start_codon:yes stop_codon:yes gene_type:complete
MARKSQRLRRQRRVERIKTTEQEVKMSKTIEDNSAILERMKIRTNIIDEYLKKPLTAKEETEEETPTTTVVEPEPIIEMKIQPFNEPTPTTPNKAPNFNKMTKKNLLLYAKENEISVKPIMNKSQIIKAIEIA